MNALTSTRPTPTCTHAASGRARLCLSRPRLVAARAETGEKPAGEKAGEKAGGSSGDGTFYNDERPLPKKPDMSPEFQKKLRDEYLGLGGSPDTPMRTNYFVVIGAVIALLAVLSKLTGAI